MAGLPNKSLATIPPSNNRKHQLFYAAFWQ